MQYDPRYTLAICSVRWSMPVCWGKKNGRSYFAAEENALPVTAATDTRRPRRCAFTANTLLPLLQQRAALPVVRLRGGATAGLTGPGAAVQINEAFTVSVTDGRTASQLAGDGGGCLCGRCRPELRRHGVSGGSTTATPLRPIRRCFTPAAHWQSPQVEFIKDSPALIVARVLSSLINESVIMVESGVCSPEDITSAVAGVNYADGIFGFLDSLGRKTSGSTLSNLAQLLHAATLCAAITPFSTRRAKPALGRPRLKGSMMSINDDGVYLIDGTRTAISACGGSPAHTRPDDMAATIIRSSVAAQYGGSVKLDE